jgi:hypothetical protein
LARSEPSPSAIVGSLRALVIAPCMVDFDATGGGVGPDAEYAKRPKGNVDVTGRYFVWTSNHWSAEDIKSAAEWAAQSAAKIHARLDWTAKEHVVTVQMEHGPPPREM